MFDKCVNLNEERNNEMINNNKTILNWTLPKVTERKRDAEGKKENKRRIKKSKGIIAVPRGFPSTEDFEIGFIPSVLLRIKIPSKIYQNPIHDFGHPSC